jgi:5-methylthioadenosine/S-adenosylhomocysteine deaminase
VSEAGTLLLPRYLLPIRPAATVLEDHAVRLLSGRIVDVLPVSEAQRRYPDDESVSLPRHVLLPGLINMHTHSPMTLLRGYADDLTLNDWLRKRIWPAEQRWVSREFVRDGAALAITEMLLGGTTCFNEMYFFPEVIADLVNETGMRAQIGVPVIDVETPWAAGIEVCLDKASHLLANWESHERVQIALAPHAPYTVDDAGLEATAVLAREAGATVNMHVLEAAWEVDHAFSQHGISTLERLERHALLGPNFLGVHMVHVSTDDIRRLADTGTHVIHCPESNLKLANGVSPVPAMLAAGINVAIGTDGAASNNDLDLLGETRTAALIAKGFSGDPKSLDAWQALELMTLNGARGLGMENELGTIETGKWADLCAIDLDAPATQPVHHAHSQVIYSAAASQVTDVWVAGKRLLHDGVITSPALQSVSETTRSWNERFRAAAATMTA